MKKYLLEEILSDSKGELFEPGYDHCIEKWDKIPNNEDVYFWINESIQKYWKEKKVANCSYTLYEAEVDQNGDSIGEWEPLKYYKFDIAKARKNKDWKEYHEDFIKEVDSAEFWSDIEVDEYVSHLEDLKLDYNKYDDPDMMWADYLKAVEALDVNIEEA
mgnify:FL=1